MLQQAIRETAGGRAEVNGCQAGDVKLKMCQRMLQFVAAAADEFLRRFHGEFIAGFDAVAGFACGPVVDADLSRENESFGPFAAVAQAAFDECLIHAGHGQGRGGLLKMRACTWR